MMNIWGYGLTLLLKKEKVLVTEAAVLYSGKSAIFLATWEWVNYQNVFLCFRTWKGAGESSEHSCTKHSSRSVFHSMLYLISEVFLYNSVFIEYICLYILHAPLHRDFLGMSSSNCCSCSPNYPRKTSLVSKEVL